MASLNPVSGPLGTSRAAHLLRRTTFGPTRQDITTFSGSTAQAALTQLLAPLSPPSPPLDPVSGLPWLTPQQGQQLSMNDELMMQTLGWWFNLMKTSGNNITEKMVYFFHTHVPTIISRINEPRSLYYQIALYRYYALGNYKELMRAVAIENAMLVHLDGVLNVAGLPQENFAREYLELFTIGKGPQIGPNDYTNYTEQDVQAATKVLTGWGTDHTFTTLDPITNIPRGKLKGNGVVADQHDVSTKTFSAAFQNTQITPSAMQGGYATVAAAEQELTDMVNMIFNQPETAKFLCRKLYRFFVYWDITTEVETDIITPLSQTLINNNWNITSVLQQLLQSEHFFDADNQVTSDDNFGAIIKSPVDLSVGIWRSFNLTVPNPVTDLADFYTAYQGGIKDPMVDMGQDVYEPYDVAGYDAYHQFPGFNRNWISANYLANRYKYAEDMIFGGVLDMMGNTLVKFDVVDYVKNNISNPGDATILVQELTDLMFPIQINTARFDYFRDVVLLDTLSAQNWQTEWNNYISSNNDANVRVQLEKLFTGLMECPEYQLF